MLVLATTPAAANCAIDSSLLIRSIGDHVVHTQIDDSQTIMKATDCTLSSNNVSCILHIFCMQYHSYYKEN
jgi:hypothetical protein